MRKAKPNPTPGQIAKACAAIQATWSPQTEVFRRTIGQRRRGEQNQIVEEVVVDRDGRPVEPVYFRMARW